MESEAKFWIAAWSLVAGVIAVLVISISGYSSYRLSVLGRMIAEQHVDPMRAACALDIGDRKDAICGALAGKQ